MILLIDNIEYLKGRSPYTLIVNAGIRKALTYVSERFKEIEERRTLFVYVEGALGYCESEFRIEPKCGDWDILAKYLEFWDDYFGQFPAARAGWGS